MAKSVGKDLDSTFQFQDLGGSQMNFAKRASVMNAFGSFTAKIILVCFSAASFGARIKKARQMFSIFVLVMLLSPATYA